jgi:transposase InsO family protein
LYHIIYSSIAVINWAVDFLSQVLSKYISFLSRPKKPSQAALSGEQAFLRKRIKEIASVRIRYGYRRIHVLLKREGWEVNHKRVYRLYRQEGLNLRYPGKRRQISQPRLPNPTTAMKMNECWAMDFVSD